MKKKDEALKLALEALTHLQPTALTSFYTIGNRDKAITIIREALAEQPAQQQEPVAWMHWLHGPVRLFLNKDEAQMELERLNRDYPVDAGSRKMRPLVFGDTSPQPSKPWVGLTKAEFEQLYNDHSLDSPSIVMRAVEAKLREKNHG